MPNQVATPVVNKRPDDDLGPLPEGWEERVHSDGRIFFIDHSELYRLQIYVLQIKYSVYTGWP